MLNFWSTYFGTRQDATYSFTFAHLSDLHIGEGIADYGTPGYLDDQMPAGDVGYSAERLRQVVRWINDNAVAQDIRFVIITGDITGSAERSEFEKAKEILDSLIIPYVPIIGNHDIWPYVRYQYEAPYAYGDSIMANVFQETYQKDSLFFEHWNNGTRLTRTYDPESGHEHYFQNFSFVYQGFNFISADLNPRYHVNKAEPGIGPEARLNDFEGGTYPWIFQSIQNTPVKGTKNLVFMSHQPPARDIAALFNFELTLEDQDRLTRALLPYSNQLSLWLCGHIHRNTNYTLRTIGGGFKVMDVKETAANKEYDHGFVSLIRAYSAPIPTGILDNKIASQIVLYPNPSSNYIITKLPANFKATEWSIYNTSGRLVSNQKINPYDSQLFINISQLSTGNYLIQFDADDVSAQKWFVKTGN